MVRGRKSSAAAYTLVDVSALPDDVRQDVIADASAGGGAYGIRVVEESINGGARAPIFGVYKGDDEDRWNDAKKELGITSSEVDDGEVTGGPVDDPRREAALREAAAQRAEAEAERIRAGEERDIAAITGENSATDGHAHNIVDTTLAADAENEASEAQPAKPAKKSKTPR